MSANGNKTSKNGHKAKMGRPSKYSNTLADSICYRLAKGQSLREICRDPEMPECITIRSWLLDGKHGYFSTQYADAREKQADHYFEEILEIADDGSNDWIERNKFEGDTALIADHEHINRSRLRVDARKWILARMSPKKYGEKESTVIDQSQHYHKTIVFKYADGKAGDAIERDNRNRIAAAPV